MDCIQITPRFSRSALRSAVLFVFLLLAAFPAFAGAEVLPPEILPCFPGAYYRKAATSFDQWTGIVGVLKLPQPTFDELRKKPNGRYLDNPSIYLGGRCGEQEVDAGLTWEVIREADGSVSPAGKAFRPFWRVNSWNNAPAVPELYFYPGDTVRMTCQVIGPGRMQLSVELLARAAHPGAYFAPRPFTNPAYDMESPLALRAGDCLTSFSVEFEAPGFGPGKIQQFKRVNAIDQSGNEGRAVQPTTTRVDGAIWYQVWLERADRPDRIPLIPLRFTDMQCPDSDHFIVKPLDDGERGGEVIFIYGRPADRFASAIRD